MARTKRYPGNLERRGNSYRVRLCVAGRVHRFTVPTTDQRVAEQAARVRYADLECQRLQGTIGSVETLRIAELLDRFESQLDAEVSGTRRSYKDTIKPVRKYFVEIRGNPRLDMIRAADIDAYFDWRRMHRMLGRHKKNRGPLHPRTLNKDRAVLHRLFAIAERQEYVTSNPVRKTERRKADAHEPVILDAHEYDQLIDECGDNPMLAVYVLLLGETGMRCESEALHLRWEDVSFDTGFIGVVSGRDGHRTKSGRSRKVPMTARLTIALKEYFARYRFASQSMYVFHHSSTRRHHAEQSRIGTMRAAFKNAAARAKLSKRLRQHDLRHRRVTTWLAEGQSPALVMQALGHSRIETTMGYYRFLPDHLRKLVEGLPAPSPKQVISRSTDG